MNIPILPRIQWIARMSWMEIWLKMPGAAGEKELVIGRIFQTIEGDEKHGALQLRGMRRWCGFLYEMSLTFCNWLKHLARGERLVVLDELQYVEWHIVVASPRHIRKRVVDDDRHDVNVFFEDRWRVHLKRRPSR